MSIRYYSLNIHLFIETICESEQIHSTAATHPGGPPEHASEMISDKTGLDRATPSQDAPLSNRTEPRYPGFKHGEKQGKENTCEWSTGWAECRRDSQVSALS